MDCAPHRSRSDKESVMYASKAAPRDAGRFAAPGAKDAEMSMNRRCRGTGDTEALISLLAETYPREDTTDQSRGFPITSIATIDTCELFHRRPPSGFRRNIEFALGRRLKIDICRDKYGNQQGQRMIVNRPNLAVLPVLGEYRNDWGCTTYRVDVAVDFHMPNLKSAKLFHGVVDRCGVLKWRSPQTTKSHLEDDDGWITVYWCDDRRARNVILYHKRHDPRIVRLELRFMNSTAVRRAGLMYPTSLEDINPAALFNHHFKLVESRPNISNACLKIVDKPSACDPDTRALTCNPSSRKAPSRAHGQRHQRAFATTGKARLERNNTSTSPTSPNQPFVSCTEIPNPSSPESEHQTPEIKGLD